MSGRVVSAFAAAGLAAGLVVSLAVNAATDEVYRATALLEAVPPAGERPDESAEVPAATYADLAGSRGFLAEQATTVGSGRLSPRELDGRLDARHRDGTALVELVARGPTREAARELADDLAAALTAYADETARERGARIEAELRARIDQLSAAIAGLETTAGSLQSAATADRLRALRGQRAAFQRRLADVAVTAAQDRSAVVVVAPASADPDPIRPRRALNLFGGVLLGLVAGLGSSLLVRRRASKPEGEGEAEEEPPTGVDPAGPLLVRPSPREELLGTAVLEAHMPGAASLELLLSDGSPDWRSIASAEGETARVEWDTAALSPGAYWLCVVARDGSGGATVGDPVPVTVAQRELDGAAPPRAATG